LVFIFRLDADLNPHPSRRLRKDHLWARAAAS
jgi:hypothetical protein